MSTAIPKESYLVLRLGKVGVVPFVLAQFPSCKQYAINNYQISGQLSCRSQGDSTVIVEGLGADIPLGMNVGVTVSLSNPPLSGHSAQFGV